jgi:hypothetical protein
MSGTIAGYKIEVHRMTLDIHHNLTELYRWIAFRSINEQLLQLLIVHDAFLPASSKAAILSKRRKWRSARLGSAAR